MIIDPMYPIISLGILIFLSMIRFLSCHDIFTKILTVNVVSTKIILIISMISILVIQRDYLDIVLVYGLINFITMIVVAKYFREKKQS